MVWPIYVVWKRGSSRLRSTSSQPPLTSTVRSRIGAIPKRAASKSKLVSLVVWVDRKTLVVSTSVKDFRHQEANGGGKAC